MGDVSAEPSMEDILSSIKRIIAEENDAPGGRTRRTGRSLSQPPRELDEDEVLELSERLDAPHGGSRFEAPPERAAEPAPPAAEAKPVSEPRAMPQSPAAVPPGPTESILSRQAEEATRGPLEALSRLVVKPDIAGSDTLEGLVREMLRPMLREWLDANLPAMVEDMVAREITRITGR